LLPDVDPTSAASLPYSYFEYGSYIIALSNSAFVIKTVGIEKFLCAYPYKIARRLEGKKPPSGNNNNQFPIH
jgi:hypothetical protein